MSMSFESYLSAPSSVRHACTTFGVFDGIHDGHLLEIRYAIEESEKNNKKSGIITFDVDPDEIFDKNFKKLMTNENRIFKLKKSGVDFVVPIKFDSVKDVPACDFLDVFFRDNKPYSIHVGSNFFFGKGAKGDVNMLSNWGAKNYVKIHVHNLLKSDGKIISSTAIRQGIMK